MKSDAWIVGQKLPKGYSLSVDGVRANGRVITLTPIIPDACFSDPETGQGFVRLSWAQDGFVRRRVVSRSDLSKGRFGPLAEMGMDLGSHNRMALGRYFRAVEASSELPHRRVSKQFGWDSTKDSFLLGNVCITESGIFSSDPCGDLDGPLFLSPAACETFTDGVCQDGSLDGWSSAARIALRHPRAATAIFAAAAPPMLRILGAPSLGIQWSGPGGSGKSTCAQLAASVWGSPDPSSPAPFLMRWGSDRRWLEQAAVTLRDLPVVLDEATEAMDRWGRASSILAGISEGKIERGEVVPPVRWSTCLVASGVCGLNDDCPEDLAGKLFDLWGPPFVGDGVIEDLAEIQEGIQANFGHFGPALVQRLLQKKEFWPKWRAKYLETRKSLITWGSSISGPASRIAQHLATFRMVSIILANLFPELEIDPAPSIQDLQGWIEKSSTHAPQAVMAMEQIMEWLAKNQERIRGLQPRDDRSDPPGGWIGRTDQQGHIWVMQGLLSEALVERGFNPEKCLREWWASGDLIPGPKGQAVVHQWIGKFSRPCVGFTNKDL